jgi:hypothetical protein
VKGRELGDEDIRGIIEAYIRCEGNKVHVQDVTGAGYSTVNRYVKLWQEGRLEIKGLPEVRLFGLAHEVRDAPTVKRLKDEHRAIKLERDVLLKEAEELRKVAAMVTLVEKAERKVPDWIVKKPGKGQKGVIATAFLSDVHLDEVIQPEQVNWVNAYNREIAEKRLRLFFENTIELARDYLAGFRYEGLVLPLGGDIFAGIIHEELVESNEGTIFESMLHWADPMCAGIKLVRDAFGRVFLPCVVGNHGRRQRKPHAKNRAQDNFEYMFYHLLRRLLANEKGLEFVISEAADQPFRVYDTRYLLTHGDQFKGGSGIAGLWSPLMLGDARKRARENAVQRPYDHMIMGHWHQLKFFGNIIVNGSVSGLDEYAFLNNFGYEPPRQAFWVTDSTHGVTITAPIHVAAKDEVYSAATGDQAIVGIGWGNERKTRKNG